MDELLGEHIQDLEMLGGWFGFSCDWK